MFLFIILANLAIIILHAIIYLFGKVSIRLKKLAAKIKSKIYWNVILRICIEGYFDFSITAPLNLGNLMWNTPSDYFSSICSMVATATVLLFPFIVVGILYRYRKKLTEKEFHDKFGSIMEGIDPNNKIAAFTFTVFFCLRRLAFAAVLLYLQNYPSV